jgi:hypothetical protein
MGEGGIRYWAVQSGRVGVERGGIKEASYSTSSLFEGGPDRGFRNVGKTQSDVGEIPKRIYTISKTRRKFEIKIT